jgi:glycosyltransferase involved in cell wall biosynthesis
MVGERQSIYQDGSGIPGPGSPAARRPRVLLISDRVPGTDSGYGIRISNVIEGLSDVGDLHVCLIDSSTGGESLPIDQQYSTSLVRAKNPARWHKVFRATVGLTGLPYRQPQAVRSKIEAAVGRQVWDLIWFSRARTYWISRALLNGPKVVDFDDLGDRLSTTMNVDRRGRHGRITTAPRNLLGFVESRRWRRIEHLIASEVDRVVVCSDEDRRFLGVANCAVVGNGYPTPEARERRPVMSPPTLLFVGPLSYEPNRLAAEWLAFEMLPLLRRRLPTARLVVVGHNDGASEKLLNANGTTLAGYAQDLGSYYTAASVAVTPLHSGGGTRLKVIEALARSVPLVSTSFACLGLGLTHDKDVLIADDAAGFADACRSIIEDPALAKRLTIAGLARYQKGLTAEDSSAAVAALAASVMNRPESRRRPEMADPTPYRVGDAT